MAIHDLEWLLEKFKPIPDWHDNSEVNLVNAGEVENPDTETTSNQIKRGIIFYTDNQLKLSIAHAVQSKLKEISAQKDISITSASLKPMNLGKNVHINQERGVETYFTQIVAALEASDADIVYFCEHDVIYHESHFDFIPPSKDKFYYNQNFWRIREDGFAVHWDANQVSGLVCDRKLALEFYKNRLKEVQEGNFNRSYEPGGRDESKYKAFFSPFPNIDVRHQGTLTKSKWSPKDFRDKSTCVNWQESDINHIPGWDGAQLQKVF